MANVTLNMLPSSFISPMLLSQHPTSTLIYMKAGPGKTRAVGGASHGASQPLSTQQVPVQAGAAAPAERGEQGVPRKPRRQGREAQGQQRPEQDRRAVCQVEEHAEARRAPRVVDAEDVDGGEGVLDLVVHLPVPLLEVAQHTGPVPHHEAAPPVGLRVADLLDQPADALDLGRRWHAAY
eukprot:757037-Hanusia_phi.AAC.1